MIDIEKIGGLIPLAFIVYNRPDKTEDVLKALMKCQDIDRCIIYAFSDEARNANASSKVEEVRNVLKSYQNKLNIQIVARKENYGCSKNIALGVSSILKKYEYVIYVEDDVIPNGQFISYMIEQLEKYKLDNTVFSINSYNQLQRSGEEEIYKSERFSSWGTGLYQRSWKNVKFNFNADNKLYGYSAQELKKIKTNKIKTVAPDLYITYLEHRNGFHTWNNNGDMWDIQCFYYMLMNNLVAITPYKNYSTNVGILDGTGIHERREGMSGKISAMVRITMAHLHITGIVQKLYKLKKR